MSNIYSLMIRFSGVNKLLLFIYLSRTRLLTLQHCPIRRLTLLGWKHLLMVYSFLHQNQGIDLEKITTSNTIL